MVSAMTRTRPRSMRVSQRLVHIISLLFCPKTMNISLGDVIEVQLPPPATQHHQNPNPNGTPFVYSTFNSSDSISHLIDLFLNNLQSTFDVLYLLFCGNSMPNQTQNTAALHLSHSARLPMLKTRSTTWTWTSLRVGCWKSTWRGRWRPLR